MDFPPDIHICGACRAEFDCINEFTEHKKYHCLVMKNYYRKRASKHTTRSPGNSVLVSGDNLNVFPTAEILKQNLYPKKISPNEYSCDSNNIKKAENISSFSDSCQSTDKSTVQHPVSSMESSSSELHSSNIGIFYKNLPLINDKLNCINGMHAQQNRQDIQAELINNSGDLTMRCSSIVKQPTPHKRKKPLEKRHRCLHTGCTFASAYPKDLVRHCVTHSRDRPFVCNICSRRYSRKDKLSQHLKDHTGEKRFKCERCEYRTSHRSSMIKHKRIHTGEKPFTCQVCSKSFCNSSQLTVHLRVHTGDAPFSCPVCRAAFKINSDLVRHLRTHTGEKPYTCDMCNYSCSVKGNLKVHYKVSHGPDAKVYTCKNCDHIAKSRSDLRSHIRKQHPLKPCEKKDTAVEVEIEEEGDLRHKKIRSSNVLSSLSSSKSAYCKYTCDQCPATFYRLDAFRSHQRQHRLVKFEKGETSNSPEMSASISTGASKILSAQISDPSLTNFSDISNISNNVTTFAQVINVEFAAKMSFSSQPRASVPHTSQSKILDTSEGTVLRSPNFNQFTELPRISFELENHQTEDDQIHVPLQVTENSGISTNINFKQELQTDIGHNQEVQLTLSKPLELCIQSDISQLPQIHTNQQTISHGGKEPQYILPKVQTSTEHPKIQLQQLSPSMWKEPQSQVILQPMMMCESQVDDSRMENSLKPSFSDEGLVPLVLNSTPRKVCIGVNQMIASGDNIILVPLEEDDSESYVSGQTVFISHADQPAVTALLSLTASQQEDIMLSQTDGTIENRH